MAAIISISSKNEAGRATIAPITRKLGYIIHQLYGYGVGVEVLPKHHKKILMKIWWMFSFAWKFKRFHWSNETCQPSQPIKTLAVM